MTMSYRPSSTTSWNTMKFARMISSIRRNAWKQFRSCSPCSDSMCEDSLARCPLAGGMRSRHPVDELLDEQIRLHRIASLDKVAATVDGHQFATGYLGELHTRRVRDDVGVGTLGHPERA